MYRMASPERLRTRFAQRRPRKFHPHEGGLSARRHQTPLAVARTTAKALRPGLEGGLCRSVIRHGPASSSQRSAGFVLMLFGGGLFQMAAVWAPGWQRVLANGVAVVVCVTFSACLVWMAKPNNRRRLRVISGWKIRRYRRDAEQATWSPRSTSPCSTSGSAKITKLRSGTGR
jgi:hypothetical protein